MVTLHEGHPRSVDAHILRQLKRLSMGNDGQLLPYLREDDEWDLGDRIFYVKRGEQILAWALRRSLVKSTYWHEKCFQVYVRRNARRQGWGTVLYQHAMKRVKRPTDYHVYAGHSRESEVFYEALGRKDWY